MTIALRLLSASLAAAGALALAGCMSGGPGAPPGSSTAPKGVEGSWLDAQGIAISTFTGGSFTTVDARTGAKLATGTYINTAQNAVEITGNSLVRANAPLNLNCILVSTSQLNCTGVDGSHFTFSRRA